MSAARAIALQSENRTLDSTFKVMTARIQAAVRFEREHSATIRDFDSNLQSRPSSQHANREVFESQNVRPLFGTLVLSRAIKVVPTSSAN